MADFRAQTLADVTIIATASYDRADAARVDAFWRGRGAGAAPYFAAMELAEGPAATQRLRIFLAGHSDIASSFVAAVEREPYPGQHRRGAHGAGRRVDQ